VNNIYPCINEWFKIYGVHRFRLQQVNLRKRFLRTRYENAMINYLNRHFEIQLVMELMKGPGVYIIIFVSKLQKSTLRKSHSILQNKNCNLVFPELDVMENIIFYFSICYILNLKGSDS
jgi:hypothetical protein